MSIIEELRCSRLHTLPVDRQGGSDSARELASADGERDPESSQKELPRCGPREVDLIPRPIQHVAIALGNLREH